MAKQLFLDDRISKAPYRNNLFQSDYCSLHSASTAMDLEKVKQQQKFTLEKSN